MIKETIFGIVFVIILSGVGYIFYLKEMVSIAEKNEVAYQDAIQTQSEVLTQKIVDYESIRSVNKTMLSTIEKQKKEIQKLNDVFNTGSNGKKRDLGEIARAKPGLVTKLVNNATDRVNRCFEIATGSKVIEGEKNESCQDIIDYFSSTSN